MLFRAILGSWIRWFQELYRAKILKLKSLETIADELECGVEEIRGLYDAVKECGPESNVDEIMKVVMQSKC